MRAGNGMVEGMLTILPTARVYHLGLYREKSTLLPVEYYNKLPSECHLETGFIVDPMVIILMQSVFMTWGIRLLPQEHPLPL